jgi:predicted aldo/keto reductase-like oxidoreductase
MEKRRLGRTGMDVSVIGFGAIRAKGAEALSEVLEEGRNLGINLVDTARAYPGSEETLGKAFGENRAKHIICSRTQSRTHVDAEKDLAESLKMLQTDYIDIYQIHQLNAGELDRVIQDDGVAQLLEKAKADGRIKATGISAHHLDEAGKALSTGLFDTLTIPFSPVEYSAKHLQLIQLAKSLDVGVMAMKPMSGGSFVHRIEDNLSFILQHDIASAIPGTASVDELKLNAGAAENRRILSLDELDSLMAEAAELGQSFCRRCGYCLPCEEGIPIREIMMSDAYLRGNARMAAMFGGEKGLEFFRSKVEQCTVCGTCVERCPYDLPIPDLMPGKLDFFQEVLDSLK